MKEEDYLWDRKGQDAEIERLENALRVFRCRETAPPVSTAEIIPFKTVKKTSRRRNFSPLTLAAAACLLAIISIAAALVRLQVSTEQNNGAVDSAMQARVLQTESASPTEKPLFSDSEPADDKNFAVYKPPVARKVFKIRRTATMPIAVRRNTAVARNFNNPKTAEIRLTKEEKHAYNQLMLALSITSSKLKIVKDKVESAEENSAVQKNGR